MTPVDVVIIVALALAAIDELDARGRKLTTWAVILLCIALLWGSWA